MADSSLPEKNTIIYVWICKRTGAPMYVGKTSRSLKERTQSHISKSLRSASTPKHTWLRDEVSAGGGIDVIALERCSVLDSGARERRWHKRFSKRYKLLNVDMCGAGNPGTGRIKWTPELDAMLGTVADSVIAEKLGCTRKAVSYRRETLGVAASHCRDRSVPPPQMGGHNKIKLTEFIIGQFGMMPDYKLAQIAGCNKSVISRRRRKMGVKSYASQTGNDGRIKQGEPHRRWSTY